MPIKDLSSGFASARNQYSNIAVFGFKHGTHRCLSRGSFYARSLHFMGSHETTRLSNGTSVTGQSVTVSGAWCRRTGTGRLTCAESDCCAEWRLQ